MVYPEEFKQRVKKQRYLFGNGHQNWDKLLYALNTGSPMVGYYLSERSESLLYKVFESTTSWKYDINIHRERNIRKLFLEWLRIFNEQNAA